MGNFKAASGEAEAGRGFAEAKKLAGDHPSPPV
jgi:hypothetical protein